MFNMTFLRRQGFLGPRVPPNLFAIALGIAGLAETWQAAVPVLGTPQAVPDALNVLDAAVWHADRPGRPPRPCAVAVRVGFRPDGDALVRRALHALAISSFGIGVTSWVVLSSVIFNRLFTRPALPSALVPTMAIELGIPAVAGLAYFAVAGRTVNFVSGALGGYAVLMAVAQVRLIPVYRGLSFTPGMWSFAFAYAAAAADALVWLSITKPLAATGYASAVIALLTAFVSWITFRTVVLAVRGQLFPAWSPGHQANS